MDLIARVDVNYGRKDGRTDGKPDACIALAKASATKIILIEKKGAVGFPEREKNTFLSESLHYGYPH